ncbi:class I SAM-dependent methyltransferase [Paenibacillus sp. JCM 10914]|uniref:class I SAM-dependent methyltransferase n=1 Tax=Paenibacillus sp. JCM 10914 TaxID=1236974 RepID=UPI0003CC4EC4|nr:methyltransferase domain-containing protein [Paenibacillus sp. JCM 10914]GAE07488.1 SAM-dependent methyltransferases [Paenibacillus sp. JCM 10914]
MRQHQHTNSVPKLDSGILALLQPEPEERILDIGCGMGEYMAGMASAGALPTGIDLSEKMLERARLKYPHLDFQMKDICHYRTEVPYDAVFSNAVLHWIQDAPAVARSIWLALRDGGRFVAEFAGYGNVGVLVAAMKQELIARGYEWKGRNPWYHPTIGEYASLLEQTGFRVVFAQHFDKPTALKGNMGVKDWMDSFAHYFFPDLSSTEKIAIYQAIEDQVKPQLYHEGRWVLDTSRIQIVAIKDI